MLLLFWHFLKLAEFTAPNKASNSFLLISDVFIVDGSLKLFIRRSKTDVIDNGHLITLFSSHNLVICPALASSFIDSYCIHADLTLSLRLQLSAVLSSCLNKLNLYGFHFSSHSFRVGVATTASCLGFSPEELKQVSWWDSDRYKIYARPDMFNN